jgi:NADH-quinone oxidoreductase subunit G
MAKITLDGQTHDAPPGANLLKTCLSLRLDLPYFCWHPALDAVGACRQCAVLHYKDEHDTQGRLVMACMTPVTEGLRADLEAPAAREFRVGVIEALMTNHPHDCPVCEEGGECHLQDMTLMTGHTVRRYRGRKRTHRNQYLGPFINHEMNRCIACYRCVRYYRDYAGGSDLNVFAIHNDVYFGRFREGVLDNEFSGNLVEVCPTGVFTDRTFGEHYVRKWDLRYAPSVCAHCGVGCNSSPAERLGTLRRIINRYHGEVNGYFLCDRGRFGYGHVNGVERIRRAAWKGEPIAPEAAVIHLATLTNGASKPIGIGSPRASLEANFALRELVGAKNFYAGLSRAEAELAAAILDILRRWPVCVPSVREMEQADAVLVLGEDVTHTAPRLALALRQATRNRAFEMAASLKIPGWLDAAVREAAQDAKSPLFVASVAATRLDDVASATYHGPPEDIARLGFAVAHALDGNAPAVADLGEAEARLADSIAAALGLAERPLIVSGVGCRSLAVVRAAGNVALALENRKNGKTQFAQEPQQPPVRAEVSKHEREVAPAVHPSIPQGERQGQQHSLKPYLCYTVPECNTLGLAMLDGRSVEDAFAAMRAGTADTVVVLENDLCRRADGEAVDEFLDRAKRLIAIDHSLNPTSERAELRLPSGTFVETEGTLVSLEGRAQRLFSVMPPIAEARDSWRWPVAAMRKPWPNLDAVTAACAAAFPALTPIIEAAPSARFRIDGAKVAREPARCSGRTAMCAHQNLHEPKPPDDPDSPLSYSMEGAGVEIPPALLPVEWAPRWNSHQQATAKFQEEAGGPLRGGDPGIRLIEPAENPSAEWFGEIPPGYKPDESRWRIVPLYHIFGGDELSALSPPIAERTPALYAALHPDDHAALGGTGSVAVHLNGRTRRLPVREEPSLRRGTVGLPVDLPDLVLIDLFLWVTLDL